MRFVSVFIITLLLVNLSIEYYNLKTGGDCMLRYVQNSKFGNSTGYLQKLFGKYNHIDYKVNGLVYGTCQGCFCSDILSTYQCFNVLLLSNLIKG